MRISCTSEHAVKSRIKFRAMIQPFFLNLEIEYYSEISVRRRKTISDIAEAYFGIRRIGIGRNVALILR